MARTRQTIESKRRTPTQDRARVTREAIFEAAARILEREGRAALNTNRIAERAGVSIGTLYQYFANKEEILIAMARRRVDADNRTISGLLAEGFDDPAVALERVAIHAAIESYRDDNRVRRVVMEALIAAGRGQELSGPMQDIAALLATRPDRVQSSLPPDSLGIRLFVVTRAVEAVVRAAAYEAMPFFGTAAFEDELVELVRGYLRLEAA